MRTKAGWEVGVRRGLTALVAASVVSFLVSGAAFASPGPGPSDDETGCWESVMSLTVTSQPAATGQSGQATVSGIPVGSTRCGSGPSASGPFDMTWVGLFWAAAGQDDNTAVQVGTCTAPSAEQTTCSFSIPTSGQGYLFAGGDNTPDSNWHEDNNNDPESNQVAFTVVPPNQLPEVPYAALLPLLLIGGAVAVRHLRHGKGPRLPHRS